MRCPYRVGLIMAIMFGAVAAGATVEVTPELVEAGGGLQQYGWELEQMFAARVGEDLAGMTIEANGYHMFPPTLSYRLRFDSNRFFADLISRVRKQTGGKDKDADLVMAYVLVFEREGMLRRYLGSLAGAALCQSQPERSALDVGYNFSFGFYHLDPPTFTYTADGNEETVVREQIGSFKHSASTCEEFEAGIRDPEETLSEAIATMIATIDNGMARRRYEIIDNRDDEAWRARTLGLIKRLQ